MMIMLAQRILAMEHANMNLLPVMTITNVLWIAVTVKKVVFSLKFLMIGVMITLLALLNTVTKKRAVYMKLYLVMIMTFAQLMAVIL
jgi:hypothetical protein